jgi:hypothetical protein
LTSWVVSKLGLGDKGISTAGVLIQRSSATFISVQDRLIDNGNASRTGSALERYINDFAGRFENASTRTDQIKSVNFPDAYGPIRQVANLTDGIPRIKLAMRQSEYG